MGYGKQTNKFDYFQSILAVLVIGGGLSRRTNTEGIGKVGKSYVVKINMASQPDPKLRKLVFICAQFNVKLNATGGFVF